MPIKSPRQKGHSFERTIADDFRLVGFPRARTSRQVSRLADDCKIDIVGTFPFAPQCKALKGYASLNEIAKIEWEKFSGLSDEEPRNYIPMLITKGDRKPAMVALPWEDFKNILKLAYAKPY